MKIVAKPEKKFLLKYLVIGLGCLAFAAWSLYDGLVKFPAKIPRAQAWEELRDTYPEEEWGPRWRELSKEKGWSSKRPKKDDSVEAVESKIVYQWVFLAIGLGIGIPCVLWYLKTSGTWVELDDNTVKSSSGDKFEFSQVTQFDKKKWEKKGIGVIHYDDGEGTKKFVLDDLKYERKAMDDIVRAVEDNISHDLIVNGPPEGAVVAPVDTDEDSDTDEDELED